MDGKKKELDTGIQFFQIESFAVNFIFIDTGEECDAGFFEVYLPGAVYEAMYKRDMYTSRAAQTSQGKPKADFMKFIILIYDFRKIGIIFVNGHCKTKTTTI